MAVNFYSRLSGTNLVGPLVKQSAIDRNIQSRVAGETVRVDIPDDTHITLQNPNTNYGNLQYVRVAQAAANTFKGLWYADVSAYNGRTVISATLNLYMFSGGAHTLDFYGLTADWIELEATWNNRKAGTPWTTPGGDYDGAAFTSQFLDGTMEFKVIDCTSIMADWLGAVRSNYGILSWCAPAGSLTTFRSAEVGAVDERPYFEMLLA